MSSSRTGDGSLSNDVPNPPRLMVLTHSYWPEHSPPQRRWSSLTREFIGAGWDVEVVTPVAHYPNGRRDLPRRHAGYAFGRQSGPHGERIRRVPYLRHLGRSPVARLVDQLFSAILSVPVGLGGKKPDAILATAPSLPTLATGYVLSRFRRVPLIVEMRDAWPDLARDARLVQGSVKSLVERAVEFVQHRADMVVTVTEGFAQTLRDRGLRNVVTVSNGLDLHTVPFLDPPALERDVFHALYLGNHGKSQRLDILIRASALLGEGFHLTLVGSGTNRQQLVKLARELDAPVSFFPSLHGPAVLEKYSEADTCIVSLRDDWKSFETTVPSKTYEVLAVGRHVTAIVKGEAKRIIEDARGGDVVGASPEAVAELWRDLSQDRARLAAGRSGREWVRNNADYAELARQYMGNIASLLGRDSCVPSREKIS
ncbi:glycosyltransferase family 4 protein [Arthrobacter sp. TES]|nr:glycosyltransferase family 4 protein [Paenarthrobacter sp. AT5]QOI62373.1 glycosyltransferase family 4 protein [Arthrobacter sp. TES]QSZ52985.1 glycosyltransferase WbuB [Paenarthrobacter ureafaciens]WOC60202.1 glycosyltransferase family 4 protein [Paenarthrobacter sp. AT5]